MNPKSVSGKERCKLTSRECECLALKRRNYVSRSSVLKSEKVGAAASMLFVT